MRWSARKAFGPWGQDRVVYDKPREEMTEAPTPTRISQLALDQARSAGREAVTPWEIAQPAPGVVPSGMAMDWEQGAQANLYDWAINGAFSEGVAFLGYPYLSELSQRAEYRQIVKKYAEHMTRKWIKLTGGPDDYRDTLMKALDKFHVKDVFREVLEHDGFFGRGQIFIDLGRDEGPEVATPLALSKYKIFGKLRNLKPVEPIWSYPGRYESTNPLNRNYYKPQEWYVTGKTVHASRMVTVVGREMPDMLKPAYAFGGLARTQMAQTSVENYLRTRQSISDLVHSFSVWVLKTNMATVFTGIKTAMNDLLVRVGIFNEMRDNQGTFVIDKGTEEFENVSASVAGLEKLQSQALELICVAAALPVTEFCGTAPSGLNASSEGEIRTFYTNIATDQERMLRDPLTYIMQVVMLSEYGEINPDVSFEFEPLWEMSAKELAEIETARATVDSTYVGSNIVSADEARERIMIDETSQYHGVNLTAPAPAPELESKDVTQQGESKDAK